MDNVEALWLQGIEVANDNNPYTQNEGGEGAPDVIDLQIYPTGCGHSGIFPRCTSGVVNWDTKSKDIGEEELSTMLYTPLFFDIYPIKYIDNLLIPNTNDHMSTPLKMADYSIVIVVLVIISCFMV